MLVFLYIYLSVLGFCFAEDSTTVQGSSSKLENASPPVTQTVYGFLDFTTTIGNTVMVFSPQSAATTSTKPPEPVTIIKDKPQTEEPVTEILPSKAKTHSQIDQENANDKHSALSFSTILTVNPGDNQNQSLHTLEVSKITTNVKNTATTTKNKLGKSLPISLSVSTISSKSTPNKKLKSGTKQLPIIHKDESANEANSFKKLTQKSHSTTKSPTNKKTDKTSHNVTTKSRSVSKTEKPKITVKASSKPASPVFNPQSPVIPKEHINQSVIVASKVEVREGSISVHKVKKPVVKANNAKNPALFSVVDAKKTSERENSSETNTLSEQEERNQTSSFSEESAVISSSDVSAPEYDYLSRQPSEVVDETFRVIDLKPNSDKYEKGNSFHSTPANIYEETQPLGLITSLTESMIRDGLTTVFETNVIGTVISGKYAQVLQSNSHIQPNAKKIKPSSAVRILKTVAPTNKGSLRVPSLEATPVYEEDSSSVPIEVLYNGEQGIKPSRKLSLTNNNHDKNKFAPSKNKFKDDYRDEYGNSSAEGEEESFDIDYSNPTSPSYQSSTMTKTATTKKSSHNGRPFKLQNNRFNRPTTPEISTVSVFSEDQSTVTPSYSNSGNRRFSPSNRRTTVKPVTTTETQKTYSNAKRSYKTKIGPTNIGNNNIDLPVTLPTYKFKLARPTGRWQYKTSPKPRVTIRRQDENLDNATVSSVLQFTPDVQLKGSDQDLSVSGIYPALQHEDNSVVQDIAPSVTAETLRVEISTPADFKDVYFEIATIKSPYSFQVGTVKNTRFITITSTFEKSLLQPTETPSIHKSEPLSENILASTHNAYDKEPPLDSSIATLPPIKLAGDAETPPLETMTESFSTTQLMLKTHILPVIREGSDTTQYTLVQSYHVTRLVTATKTLPPMEVYQFVPSKTLNEFNTRLDEAGSEVHLELDFGDSNEQDDESPPKVAKALLSELNLTNVGSDFDIADVDNNKILEQHLHAKKLHHKLTTSTTPQPTEAPTTPALSPEQLQQLAILRLLNPNAAIPSLITSSRPVIKIETAYDTHVLPIFNGGSTFFTTISRPTATLTKTDYEVVTNTLPAQQSSMFNPLFPQPSFQVATTPFVMQTLVTQTNSKVLKLTFGAKTSYTTLFSTKVTPTVLTTYLTNSIPVQPTVTPFPGFFNPAPYGFNPPYPFVG